MYAELGFDVLMGGGDEFFNPLKEKIRKTFIPFIEKRTFRL
jgi:alkaline phosphatase